MTLKEAAREVDLLIGADYYWTVVDGGVKKCSCDGLTAINTKFGWVLSGPYDGGKAKNFSSNFVTHAMKIEMEENDCLQKAVEKLWDLETMGVKDEEAPVYEKFLDEVKFKDGRYEVSLPFKENRPYIEDNFGLSLRRLSQLKIKDSKLLNAYDAIIAIMKKQLAAGIIEQVNTDPTMPLWA